MQSPGALPGTASLQLVAGDSTSPASFDMWVIYDHPLDYPAKWVARRWFITNEGKLLHGLGDVMLLDDYDTLRGRMEGLGLVRIERSEEDDPVIAEVWL